MTNEIKEIDNSDLMELLETTSKKEYYRLTIDHELVVRLYNWITNLQDQVKGIREERNYLFNKLSTENKYLQEENERLKNLYTNEKSHKIDFDYFKVLYSKADKDIIIEDLVYKCEQCRVLYDSAEKELIENNNLQQRIDKATDYLLDKYVRGLLGDNEVNNVVKILRGDE